MIGIDHNRNITKIEKGKGLQKLSIDEVSEKELLLFIAAKLFSIRGMIFFFTILTLISILLSFIAIGSVR